MRWKLKAVFAVDVDDDILIRETSGWLGIVSIVVWRKDCKEGKAVVMIRILRCKRAKPQVSIQNCVSQRDTATYPLTSILFAV